MRIFNGKNIYGSARDIGNIIAGYYCGLYDIKWIHVRAVFDMYQSFVLKKIATEGISSQSAQLYGYSLGQMEKESLSIYSNLEKKYINQLVGYGDNILSIIYFYIKFYGLSTLIFRRKDV